MKLEGGDLKPEELEQSVTEAHINGTNGKSASDTHDLVPSVLDHLRQKRDDLARTHKNIVLSVPGYNNALVVRYHFPDSYRDITRAMERAAESTNPDALLIGNIDLLIVCCDAVLGRIPDGQLVDLETNQLIDSETGLPIGTELESDWQPPRFDKKLASLLRIEVPDTVRSVPRHVLRHVFSPGADKTGRFDGDLALIGQGSRVVTWLQNLTDESAEEFSGES